MGVDFEIVHTHGGDELPSLDGYQALIALGGAMNAEDDDNHPYLADVVTLLQDATARNLPTLGVCLGGQLIARALGARVWQKPSMEIGYFPIDLTEAGLADPLFRGFDRELMAFQWHEDAFDLPLGATLLADSTRDTLQAFRYRNSYGLQFHPEIEPNVIELWTGIDGASLEQATLPTTVQELLDRAHAVERQFSEQTKRLCANWVAIVEEAAAQRAQ
jgi:GMP synthase-like glutamine amidotransferase